MWIFTLVQLYKRLPDKAQGIFRPLFISHTCQMQGHHVKLPICNVLTFPLHKIFAEYPSKETSFSYQPESHADMFTVPPKNPHFAVFRLSKNAHFVINLCHIRVSVLKWISGQEITGLFVMVITQKMAYIRPALKRPPKGSCKI